MPEMSTLRFSGTGDTFEVVDKVARERIAAATREEALARKAAYDLLDARISSLLALKEGSTTGDAELMDARIGYDGTTHESAGAAVRGQVNALRDEIEKRERKKYGDTPFYVIDYDQNSTHLSYKSDGSTSPLTKCSPILKCPRYLGFHLSGESRMFLYIGDMVDGTFVLDESFVIYETSGGVYNYLQPIHNRFIETDGTKYFYYCVFVDEGVEIIGADTFPGCEFDSVALSPYFFANAGEVGTSDAYYSMILPTGCYYAVYAKADTAYDIKNMNIGYETDASETTMDLSPSFGYIPDNAGAVLLRIPKDCPIENVFVYVSKVVKANADSGMRRRAREIAADIVRKFSFESKKEIAWSDSEKLMKVGERFFGVPYSSRWTNSHHVGFEVSPETALNALNDEYSVAYDGGYVLNNDGDPVKGGSVSGHSEISIRGGAGYGLVCSSFAALICGNPYPQTNRGYTFDSNFAIAMTNELNPGAFLIDSILSHVVFVDEIYNNGYSLYEGVQPCAAKTVHTNYLSAPKVLKNRTGADMLDDYIYALANRDKSGYDYNFLDFDVVVANGSIRPWRGNKAVYGPWDKSEEGSSIGITVHDGANVAYLVTPSETVHSLNVSGLNYLDISEYVTEDGIYTLYSDVSETKEYFKYYSHDVVTLTFDPDGKAVFDSEDVEYVYATVAGFGGDFGRYVENSNGPIVIAAGKYYPDLANNPERIRALYACIVSDPDDECWGRYSCMCNLNK